MTAPVGRPVRAQLAATGIVRGRVIAVDTDAPVRKVRVALTPEGATATEPIYTNADGEFEFMNVAPGRYTLAALKTGYVIARFGARSQFDRTTNIAVAAGATIGGLELPLVRSAVITGRIVDYIDEDALINYMIVIMLADNEEINHPKSIFMYKPKNGKYMMGPLWDFDWCFGFESNYVHLENYDRPLFWSPLDHFAGTRFFHHFLKIQK